MKFAIIKTGGKQYFVKQGDELYVDYLKVEKDTELEVDTLAAGDLEKKQIILGKPILKDKTRIKLLENLKGDKLRVARFRAKSRYRKVRGFRPQLSKIKITSI